MRLHCTECGKSVSSEVPDDTVVRAILTCPECVPKIVRDTPAEKKHDWRFYANGTFCLRCGVAIGDPRPCQ